MATLTITDEQRRWRMAHRHRLTEAARTDNIASITNDLIALHSSDPATVYLTALVRMSTPSIAAIDRALYDDKSVVRHHAMRRTLWVMTPSVARLAHGAATAKVAAAERRKTIDALINGTEPGAITDADAWLDNAHRQITAVLAEHGGHTTRALGQRIPELTVPVTFGWRTKHPGFLKAHTKVLQGGGFEGRYVRGRPTGNWNSSEYEWHVTESWLGHEIAGPELGEPDGLGERDAAAALLQRWLPRFGPVTETDIAWWFGWTKTLTRASLAAAEAVEVQLEDGRPAWLAADDLDPVEDPGPWVRLLPGLDPTTMGWKERNWYLTPDKVTSLFDRFGNAGPIVMIDGHCRGPWVQRDDGQVVYDLGVAPSDEHKPLLDAAIEQLTSAVDGVIVRPRFPTPGQKALA